MMNQGSSKVGENEQPASAAAAAARAGLCVRVDESAWSRALDISIQGAGGPFQVRWVEGGCMSKQGEWDS